VCTQNKANEIDHTFEHALTNSDINILIALKLMKVNNKFLQLGLKYRYVRENLTHTSSELPKACTLDANSGGTAVIELSKCIRAPSQTDVDHPHSACSKIAVYSTASAWSSESYDVGAMAALTAVFALAVASKDSQPSFLFILGDDIGW
jgi:hypothetical protein